MNRKANEINDLPTPPPRQCWVYVPPVIALKTRGPRLGTRIAEQRKNSHITQVQLAQTLGVSQSTINAYEFGQRRVPVSALPLLARTLGVSMDELVDDTPSGARKRGPAPKLLQHLERITALPKPRQRAVMDVIEAMLAQPGR